VPHSVTLTRRGDDSEQTAQRRQRDPARAEGLNCRSPRLSEQPMRRFLLHPSVPVVQNVWGTFHKYKKRCLTICLDEVGL
jgi:hypothetical protein